MHVTPPKDGWYVFSGQALHESNPDTIVPGKHGKQSLELEFDTDPDWQV